MRDWLLILLVVSLVKCKRSDELVLDLFPIESETILLRYGPYMIREPYKNWPSAVKVLDLLEGTLKAEKFDEIFPENHELLASRDYSELVHAPRILKELQENIRNDSSLNFWHGILNGLLTRSFLMALPVFYDWVLVTGFVAEGLKQVDTKFTIADIPNYRSQKLREYTHGFLESSNNISTCLRRILLEELQSQVQAGNVPFQPSQLVPCLTHAMNFAERYPQFPEAGIGKEMIKFSMDFFKSLLEVFTVASELTGDTIPAEFQRKMDLMANSANFDLPVGKKNNHFQKGKKQRELTSSIFTDIQKDYMRKKVMSSTSFYWSPTLWEFDPDNVIDSLSNLVLYEYLLLGKDQRRFRPFLITSIGATSSYRTSKDLLDLLFAVNWLYRLDPITDLKGEEDDLQGGALIALISYSMEEMVATLLKSIRNKSVGLMDELLQIYSSKSVDEIDESFIRLMEMWFVAKSSLDNLINSYFLSSENRGRNPEILFMTACKLMGMIRSLQLMAILPFEMYIRIQNLIDLILAVSTRFLILPLHSYAESEFMMAWFNRPMNSIEKISIVNTKLISEVNLPVLERITQQSLDKLKCILSRVDGAMRRVSQHFSDNENYLWKMFMISVSTMVIDAEKQLAYLTQTESRTFFSLGQLASLIIKIDACIPFSVSRRSFLSEMKQHTFRLGPELRRRAQEKYCVSEEPKNALYDAVFDDLLQKMDFFIWTDLDIIALKLTDYIAK